MEQFLKNSEKLLYLLISSILFTVAVAGLILQGPRDTFEGFIRLQWHSARLINDFTLIGGEGAALLNASIMGFACLILTKTSDVRLSGPTISAIFTVFGFSLFGKTPLNSAPIVLGVFFIARFVKKPFSHFLLIALFGTALGPWVTFLVVEAGFTGIPAMIIGMTGGILTGMILPALAISMLRLHEGFNLYNIGLTSGFFGLFAASLFTAAKKDMAIKIIWNNNPSIFLRVLVPAICLLLILAGLALEGKSVFSGLKKIQNLTGRLPSDFMSITSPAAGLLNMGLLGLTGSAYVWATGGHFNGPVIGGLFTLTGFGVFGKNLKNCWPIATGVIIAILIFGKELDAPGPLLAVLFGTTLAPLAGEFGILAGISAGFLHLCLVERSASWHGGLALYNNGFAGGLTATLLFAIIEWFRSNKPIKNSDS